LVSHKGLGEFYCQIADRKNALPVLEELKKLKNDQSMTSEYLKFLSSLGNYDEP